MSEIVGVRRSDRYRRFMQGLQIRDEHGMIVPMMFSESQERLWQSVAPALDAGQKLWFIVLKSRQTYASTFFESLTFTRTLEQPGTLSLVLAQDMDSSQSLFDMAKRFYDYLPLPKLVPARVKELVFPFPAGASRFRVISAGVAAKGRGTTQTCIHASECAFWPHPEILTGLFQVMPDLPDTVMVLESTANGKRGNGQMFYQEWSRAITGDSDLVPIFIAWHVMQKYRKTPALPQEEWDEEEKLLAETYGVDGEQLAWRRFAIKTKCQGSLEMFHQEYPASPDEAFIAAGLPAFDTLELMRQRKYIRDPVLRGNFTDKGEFTTNAKGAVRVWERPNASHQYVIGADTSQGVAGGDAACGQVIDMNTMEQAACIHGLIPPWDFAKALAELGKWYNKALICVEVNNTGHAVQDPLIRVLNYPNLHPWRGRPDKVRPKMANLFGWECVDPDSKVLTEDLRWIPAKDIRVGDYLLACTEAVAPRENYTRISPQVVKTKENFVAQRLEVTLTDGRKTRVSINHPFWTKRGNDRWAWICASDLLIGDVLCCLPIWETLRTYDAGRLSAFLDGEGHLSRGVQRYGLQLLISQAEGPLAEEIRDLWAQLGFKHVFKWLKHKKRPQEKPIATSGPLQLTEVLRALGSLRPTRLLRKFSTIDKRGMTTKSFLRIPVASINPIGEGVVIGLTTSPDHTLIADGIIGHNTNTFSRPLLIEAGRRAITGALATIHEQKLLDELMDFTRNDNGKYEAQTGNDDRVLAFLLALRSREENFSDAKRIVVTMSDDTDPQGVHIVEGADDQGARQRKRIGSRIRAIDRAKGALKTWLEM